MAAIFSVVDVKFFVIRLIVFFVVIGLLLMIFVSFQSIVNTNEQERSMNNLAQGLLSSDLTVKYAVFDSAKLNDINTAVTDENPGVEPVRYCGRGAFFEIFQYDASKKEMLKKWEFGYKPQFPSGSLTREYIAWIRDGTSIAPAKARITLYGAENAIHEPVIGAGIATLPITQPTGETLPTGIASLGCAVERAWQYKTIHAAEFNCAKCISMSIEDGKFCVLEDVSPGFPPLECRILPDFVKSVSLEAGKVDPNLIVTFHAIPIKEGSPANCDNPQLPGPQENVGSVILCPQKIRVVVIKN